MEAKRLHEKIQSRLYSSLILVLPLVLNSLLFILPLIYSFDYHLLNNAPVLITVLITRHNYIKGPLSQIPHLIKLTRLVQTFISGVFTISERNVLFLITHPIEA